MENIGGDETILVVEDDNSVKDLIARALRLLGYTVYEASSGPEALWMLQALPGDVHLLLTDMEMPAMSGVELAEKAAAMRPQIKGIIVSGYPGGSSNGERALPPNVNFLQKPFLLASLARRIREILETPAES
jgi:two-component system, cell cycle sensor histidine kinase and response regulator CckA